MPALPAAAAGPVTASATATTASSTRTRCIPSLSAGAADTSNGLTDALHPAQRWPRRRRPSDARLQDREKAGDDGRPEQQPQCAEEREEPEQAVVAGSGAPVLAEGRMPARGSRLGGSHGVHDRQCSRGNGNVLCTRRRVADAPTRCRSARVGFAKSSIRSNDDSTTINCHATRRSGRVGAGTRSRSWRDPSRRRFRSASGATCSCTCQRPGPKPWSCWTTRGTISSAHSVGQTRRC